MPCINISSLLLLLTDKNTVSSSSANTAAIPKGKQPTVETPQVPAAETVQAPPYPRIIMREGRARMENISRNVDNIFEAKIERFRTRLLTSPKTE